ncbi:MULTISPECIES: hypothetical protein [unclassified Sphingomonas]|uniref:hypothetical protein n=1 Tax=unclassified Sphingomonas TaxID=196159 RepID=UPI0006F25AF0|nr:MULTISPECIES: hypothetical protein [unclassified Sphingomonas]KRB90291.1 hypothetical protein ASE22_15535 [Sphingomonas sp. Root720]
MTTSDVVLHLADAVWVRDGDGISIPAHGPAGSLSIFVTRAALAAVVGKDRSEISAETARSILEDHQAAIGRVAQRQHARAPRSATLNIDYAEIEDRS